MKQKKTNTLMQLHRSKILTSLTEKKIIVNMINGMLGRRTLQMQFILSPY